MAALIMGSLVTANVCACVRAHTPVYMRSQVNRGCLSSSPSHLVI